MNKQKSLTALIVLLKLDKAPSQALRGGCRASSVAYRHVPSTYADSRSLDI